MRTLRANQHGQVTIPADIRAKLGITQETEINVSLSNHGDIILTLAKNQKASIRNLNNKYTLDMSREEFNQLIDDRRSDT
ncbi:MAG: AbrB/MazE/SpoVT family DNA-binding domain-containing protein [Endozoicomonas sp.]